MTSEFAVSGSDLTCLLLFLALFIYSLYSFYVQWNHNYQMPEGAFFYEEKTEENEEDIKVLSPNEESKKLIAHSLWNTRICSNSTQIKVC